MFINYTKVQDVVEKKFNLAPRKQFCGGKAGSDWTADAREEQKKFKGVLNADDYADYVSNSESGFVKTNDGLTTVPSRDRVYNYEREYGLQACLMFFDTQIERDIELGSRYEFDPMSEA